MKIKEVCQQTGLSERTIRFYIEKNLLSPAQTELNDRIYHDYSPENIRQIHRIAKLRKLGFSIQAIHTMQKDASQIPTLLQEQMHKTQESSKQIQEASRILEKITASTYSSFEEFTDACTDDTDHLPLPKTDIRPHFARFDDISPIDRQRAYRKHLLSLQRREKFAFFFRPVKMTLLVLLSIAVIFGIVVAVSYRPHTIQRNWQGIGILMDGDLPVSTQPISIRIDGQFRKPLFSEPQYYGTIAISGYSSGEEFVGDFPVWSRGDGKMDISVSYPTIVDGKPVVEMVGILTTDEAFSRAVVRLNEKDQFLIAPAENFSDIWGLIP